MLPTKQRITTDKEFTQIFRKGKSVHTSLFVFKYMENTRQYTRVGFVVSNKVDKHATKRNALKRQYRAIISKKRDELTKGFDCVFFVKQLSKEKDFAEIEREVLNTLKKAKLL